MMEWTAFEDQARTEGYTCICGIDEAGRGPLAGPVYAAAVVLRPGQVIEGVNDSKKLSEKKREALFDTICSQCAAYGIGSATEKEIDEINKEMVFNPLKSLCGFIGEVISEAQSDFPYPKSFASTLLETAHNQQFFSEHLPKLTDNHIKKIKHKKYVLDYLRFLTFNQIK